MDFKLLTDPTRWCFPAFTYALITGYLIIVILSLEGRLPDGTKVTMKEKVLTALGTFIWGILMLYILLILCKNGYEMYAWLLLLIPLVLSLRK
jgi:fructose-specific phosphotransferase system IIC component